VFCYILLYLVGGNKRRINFPNTALFCCIGEVFLKKTSLISELGVSLNPEIMIGPIRIYFETSSVNFLYDNVFNNNENSSIKTKKLQISKGRKWQISNITLWEIFLTKDENRRFELLDFSRSLFYDYLISSPEEIIINYIAKGCPEIETQYELSSKSLFSTEWEQACNDLDYFFEPNREQIESLTEHFRFIGEYFIKKNRGYSLLSFNELEKDLINGAFLKHIFDQLLLIFEEEPKEYEKNFIAISLQITMLILCYGIGFDQQTINAFWNKWKISNPLDRLEYTTKNFSDIFFRGPIANITRMILLQLKNKTGRGLYFDSLHSIYLTYSDLFVSNDEHFLKFKKDIIIDPNVFKIIDIKDLNYF